MKKSILYIVLILAGIFIGFGLMKIFNSNENSEKISHQESQEKQIWTCSMHPEIEQDEPGSCPICGMDLTPKDNDVDDIDPNLFSLSKRALALADIQTEKITAENTTATEKTYTGKIAATDASAQSQSAYVSGRVEKLYVNTTGKMVNKGQTLGVIYSPDLLSAQQELLSAYKRKDKNPALYKAVLNKLLEWKMSEKQIDELLENQEVKSHFPIQAMANGEVVEKLVSEGSYVEAGQELFKITDLNKLWGIIDIPENEIHHISEGDQVELSTSTQHKISGKVDLIHPLVDPSTSTIQLRVELENPDKKLKPGMLLRAKISGKEIEEGGIYIPKSAVLWTGKRSVVYVVHREENQLYFEMREVDLGNRTGDQYEILSGLTVEEEIVAHGAFTVDAAAQLQGKPSMMSKNNTQEFEISEENQDKLLEVMNYYFKLKDVFVSSDSKDIQKAAEETISKIDEISFSFEGKTADFWQTIKTQWHEIAHNLEDLEKQRLNFKKLNEHLIPLAKEIKNHKNTWYVQECPMADQNSGGFWISTESEIINPYFGDEMLNCGGIKEEWN